MAIAPEERLAAELLASLDDAALTEAEYQDPEEFAVAVLNNLPAIAYALNAGLPVTGWRPVQRNPGEEQRILRAVRQWGEAARRLVMGYIYGNLTAAQFTDRLMAAYQQHARNSYVAGRRAVGDLAAPTPTDEQTLDATTAPQAQGLADLVNGPEAPGGVGVGAILKSMFSPEAIFTPSNFLGSGLPGDPFKNLPPPIGAGGHKPPPKPSIAEPVRPSLPTVVPAEADDRVVASEAVGEYEKRIDTMGDTIRSLAHKGELDALTTTLPGNAVMSWWVLGYADHCIDCVRLSEMSPFYAAKLASDGIYPGSGHTRCGGRCQCRIEHDVPAEICLDPLKGGGTLGNTDAADLIEADDGLRFNVWIQEAGSCRNPQSIDAFAASQGLAGVEGPDPFTWDDDVADAMAADEDIAYGALPADVERAFSFLSDIVPGGRTDALRSTRYVLDATEYHALWQRTGDAIRFEVGATTRGVGVLDTEFTLRAVHDLAARADREGLRFEINGATRNAGLDRWLAAVGAEQHTIGQTARTIVPDFGQMEALGGRAQPHDLALVVPPQPLDEMSTALPLQPDGQPYSPNLGANPKTILRDTSGTEWLVKYSADVGDPTGAARALPEIVGTQVHEALGNRVAPVGIARHGGRDGTVQRIIPNTQSLFGAPGIHELDADAQQQLMRQGVVDWLIGNTDAHAGNFLLTEDGLTGIDKGLAFWNLAAIHAKGSGMADMREDIVLGGLLRGPREGGATTFWDHVRPSDVDTIVREIEAWPTADYVAFVDRIIPGLRAGSEDEVGRTATSPQWRSYIRKQKEDIRSDVTEFFRAAASAADDYTDLPADWRDFLRTRSLIERPRAGIAPGISAAPRIEEILGTKPGAWKGRKPKLDREYVTGGAKWHGAVGNDDDFTAGLVYLAGKGRVKIDASVLAGRGDVRDALIGMGATLGEKDALYLSTDVGAKIAKAIEAGDPLAPAAKVIATAPIPVTKAAAIAPSTTFVGEPVWHNTTEMVADLTARYPGADFAELASLPFSVAGPAMHEMDNTFTRFGGIPSFRGVRTPEKYRKGVLAEVKRLDPNVPGSVVILPQGYWGSEAALAKSWKEGITHPSFSVSDIAPSAEIYGRAILSHELGHEYMGLHLYSRFGAKGDPIRAKVDGWFSGFQKTFKSKKLTQYSAKNEHEAWAEAFSAAVGPIETRRADDRILELKAILDEQYPENTLAKAGIAPEPDAPSLPTQVEPRPTYVLPEVDALPAFPDMGLVKESATGSLVGVNAKKVLVDPSGQEWLWKAEPFPEAEAAAAALGARIGVRVPPVHVVEWKGKRGTLQPIVRDTHSLQELTAAAREIAPETRIRDVMTDTEISDLWSGAILDYVLANADTHPGNFIADAGGRLWSIDKGRAFSGLAVTPTRPDWMWKTGLIRTPAANGVFKATSPADFTRVLDRLDGISTTELRSIVEPALPAVANPFGTLDDSFDLLVQRRQLAREGWARWFRDEIDGAGAGDVSSEWQAWRKAGGDFVTSPVAPAGEPVRLLPAPASAVPTPPEMRSSKTFESRVGNDLGVLPEGFVPATSMPAALDRLAKVLPKTTQNVTGGFSLGQINAIVSRAELMADMGVDMTRLRRLGDFTLVPEADKARGIGLTYKGDRIALNHDYRWKFLNGVDSPDTVYNDIGGLFAHEYGHVAFAHLGAEQQGRMVELAKRSQATAGKDLSTYAASDVEEWVGEALAMITTPGYKPGTLAYDEDFWTILGAGKGTKTVVKADKAPALMKPPPAEPLPHLVTSTPEQVAAVTDRIEAMVAKDRDVWDEAERAAFTKYKQHTSMATDTGTALQRMLRGETGETADLLALRGDVDRLAAHSKATEQVVVYRGVAPQYAHTAVGETFTDLGYLSATEAPARAVSYGDTVYRMAVPTGSRFGRPPGSLTEYEEILLPRGTKWRVDAVHPDFDLAGTGKMVTVVDIVPTAPIGQAIAAPAFVPKTLEAMLHADTSWHDMVALGDVNLRVGTPNAAGTLANYADVVRKPIPGGFHWMGWNGESTEELAAAFRAVTGKGVLEVDGWIIEGAPTLRKALITLGAEPTADGLRLSEKVSADVHAAIEAGSPIGKAQAAVLSPDPLPLPKDPIGPPTPAPAQAWFKHGDAQQYTLPESALPVNAPHTAWSGYVPPEPPLPPVATTKEGTAAAKAAHDAVIRDWHDVASGRTDVAFGWSKTESEAAKAAGLHVEKIGDEYVVSKGPADLEPLRAHIAAGGSSNDDAFWHLMGYSDTDLAAYDAYYEAKKGLRLTAGVVMVEPDGRMWLLAPRNKFAGYENTWIKGGVDAGETAADAAVREMMEEAGFSVELDRYLGDYVNTDQTGIARMYVGHRTGGGPLWAHPNETYEVRLVSPEDAKDMLVRYGKPDARDQQILTDAVAALNGSPGVTQVVVPAADAAELAAKTAPQPVTWWPPSKSATPKAGIAPEPPISSAFGFDHDTWKTFTPTEIPPAPGPKGFPYFNSRWTLANGDTQSMFWQRKGGLGLTPTTDQIFWANSKKQIADPHQRLSLHVAQITRFADQMVADPTIDVLRVNSALLDNVPGLRDLLVSAGGVEKPGSWLEISQPDLFALSDAIKNNAPLGKAVGSATGAAMSAGPALVGKLGVDPDALGKLAATATPGAALNLQGVNEIAFTGGSVYWNVVGSKIHMALPLSVDPATSKTMLVASLAHLDHVADVLPLPIDGISLTLGQGADATFLKAIGLQTNPAQMVATADMATLHTISTMAQTEAAAAGHAPAFLSTFDFPSASLPQPPLTGLYDANKVKVLAAQGHTVSYDAQPGMQYTIAGTKIRLKFTGHPFSDPDETLWFTKIETLGTDPLHSTLANIAATYDAQVTMATIAFSKPVLDSVPGLAEILKAHGARDDVPGFALWLDESTTTNVVKALHEGDLTAPGVITAVAPTPVPVKAGYNAAATAAASAPSAGEAVDLLDGMVEKKVDHPAGPMNLSTFKSGETVTWRRWSNTLELHEISDGSKATTQAFVVRMAKMADASEKVERLRFTPGAVLDTEAREMLQAAGAVAYPGGLKIDRANLLSLRDQILSDAKTAAPLPPPAVLPTFLPTYGVDPVLAGGLTSTVTPLQWNFERVRWEGAGLTAPVEIRHRVLKDVIAWDAVLGKVKTIPEADLMAAGTRHLTLLVQKLEDNPALAQIRFENLSQMPASFRTMLEEAGAYSQTTPKGGTLWFLKRDDAISLRDQIEPELGHAAVTTVAAALPAPLPTSFIESLGISAADVNGMKAAPATSVVQTGTGFTALRQWPGGATTSIGLDNNGVWTISGVMGPGPARKAALLAEIKTLGETGPVTLGPATLRGDFGASLKEALVAAGGTSYAPDVVMLDGVTAKTVSDAIAGNTLLTPSPAVLATPPIAVVTPQNSGALLSQQLGYDYATLGNTSASFVSDSWGDAEGTVNYIIPGATHGWFATFEKSPGGVIITIPPTSQFTPEGATVGALHLIQEVDAAFKGGLIDPDAMINLIGYVPQPVEDLLASMGHPLAYSGGFVLVQDDIAELAAKIDGDIGAGAVVAGSAAAIPPTPTPKDPFALITDPNPLVLAKGDLGLSPSTLGGGVDYTTTHGVDVQFGYTVETNGIHWDDVSVGSAYPEAQLAAIGFLHDAVASVTVGNLPGLHVEMYVLNDPFFGNYLNTTLMDYGAKVEANGALYLTHDQAKALFDDMKQIGGAVTPPAVPMAVPPMHVPSWPTKYGFDVSADIDAVPTIENLKYGFVNATFSQGLTTKYRLSGTTLTFEKFSGKAMYAAPETFIATLKHFGDVLDAQTALKQVRFEVAGVPVSMKGLLSDEGKAALSADGKFYVVDRQSFLDMRDALKADLAGTGTPLSAIPTPPIITEPTATMITGEQIHVGDVLYGKPTPGSLGPPLIVTSIDPDANTAVLMHLGNGFEVTIEFNTNTVIHDPVTIGSKVKVANNPFADPLTVTAISPNGKLTLAYDDGTEAVTNLHPGLVDPVAPSAAAVPAAPPPPPPTPAPPPKLFAKYGVDEAQLATYDASTPGGFDPWSKNYSKTYSDPGVPPKMMQYGSAGASYPINAITGSPSPQVKIAGKKHAARWTIEDVNFGSQEQQRAALWLHLQKMADSSDGTAAIFISDNILMQHPFMKRFLTDMGATEKTFAAYGTGMDFDKKGVKKLKAAFDAGAGPGPVPMPTAASTVAGSTASKVGQKVTIANLAVGDVIVAANGTTLEVMSQGTMAGQAYWNLKYMSSTYAASIGTTIQATEAGLTTGLYTHAAATAAATPSIGSVGDKVAKGNLAVGDTFGPGTTPAYEVIAIAPDGTITVKDLSPAGISGTVPGVDPDLLGGGGYTITSKSGGTPPPLPTAPPAVAAAPAAPPPPVAPPPPPAVVGAIGAAPPTVPAGSIAGPAVAPPKVTPSFLYGYDPTFVATTTPADLGKVQYGTGGTAGEKLVMGVGDAKGYWSISSSGVRSGLFGFEHTAGMSVEEVRSAAFTMLRHVAEDGAARQKGFFIKPEFYDKVDGLRQMMLDAGGSEAQWSNLGLAVQMDAASAQKLVDALRQDVMGPITPGFKTTAEYLGYNHAQALATLKSDPVINQKTGDFTWTVVGKKPKVSATLSADHLDAAIHNITGADTVSAPIAIAAQITWIADQGAANLAISKAVLDQVPGLRQWLLTVGGKVDGGVVRLDDDALATAARMISKDALPVGLGGKPLPYSVFDAMRTTSNDVAEAAASHTIDKAAPVAVSTFTIGTTPITTRWTRSGTNVYWQSLDAGKATIGASRAAAAAQMRAFLNDAAQDIAIERIDVALKVLDVHPGLRRALSKYGAKEVPATAGQDAYLTMSRAQALKMRADIESEFQQVGMTGKGPGASSFIAQEAAAINWPIAEGLTYDITTSQKLVGAKTTAGSVDALKKLAIYRDAKGDEWLFKPGASGRGAITDQAVADLALSLGLAVPPTRIYTLTFNGSPVQGSLQKMLPGAKGVKRVEDLTPAQHEEMLRHSVLDWVTNNDDAHAGNWLIGPDGHLWAIDKSRSYQTWGRDKLSNDYMGNGYKPLLMEFFTKARTDPTLLKNVHPQTIATTLSQLKKMPDDRFRALMEPVARANRRTPAEASKLLDEMLARKNAAIDDFESYFRSEMDWHAKNHPAALPADWAAWRKAGGKINVDQTPEDVWRELMAAGDAEFGTYSPQAAAKLFGDTQLKPIDSALRSYFGSGTHGGTNVKVGGQTLHSYESEKIRPEFLAKGMEAQVRRWERLHRWALLHVLDGGTSLAGPASDTLIRQFWDPAKGTLRVTRTTAMRGGSTADTYDYYVKNGFRDMVGSAVGKWTQVGAGSTPVYMVVEVPPDQIFSSFNFGYSNTGASQGENEFMITDVRGDQIVSIDRTASPIHKVAKYNGPVVNPKF
jgi:ADP-ribose pyrophosphatase YjhB (NUDIX family)